MEMFIVVSVSNGAADGVLRWGLQSSLPSGSVLIELLNNALQLLVSQGGQQLRDEASEGLCGDEALALLVVHPEGVLQLLLHGLYVGVLHQEGGAQLAKLAKLDLSGPVLIDLMEQVGQLLLRGTEAHRPHDVTEVISGKELLLLSIEQVEADLEALDLVVGEPAL